MCGLLAGLFVVLIGLGAGAQVPEEEKPELKPWQLRGIEAALEDADPLVWAEALNMLTRFELINSQNGEITSKRVYQRTAEILESEIISPESSTEIRVRRAAILALGHMGKIARPQVNKLGEILADRSLSIEIREASAQAIGSLKEIAKEQIPRLVSIFVNEFDAQPSNSRPLWMAAADSLIKMSPLIEDEIPKLTSVLFDESRDYWLRSEAAEIIASTENSYDQILSVVSDLLNNSSEVNGRYGLATVLAKMGQEERLVSILVDKSRDSALRAAAANAIGRLENASEEQLLILATIIENKSEDIRIRSSAARSRSWPNNPPEVLESTLIKVMADTSEDNQLRLSSAWTLVGVLENVSQEQSSIFEKILLDGSEDVNLRVAVARILGGLEDAAQDQVVSLKTILNDKSQSPKLRAEAVRSLGLIGWQNPEFVELASKDLNSNEILAAVIEVLGRDGNESIAPLLSRFLSDQSTYNLGYVVPSSAIFDYPFISTRTVFSLSNIGPTAHNSLVVRQALNAVNLNQPVAQKFRFLAYYLASNNPDTLVLLKWLGIRDESFLPDPQKLSHQEAKEILEAFARRWPKDNELPQKLRNEWSRRIADIVDSQTWHTSDLPLLRTQHRNLKAIGSKHDAKLQQTIASLERWRTFGWGRNLWATHAAFWLLLIFAYPKSPPIQAIFFWNPWVRRITGLGYVGFVLAWVPFLRSRLFAPFQHSLLADAGLEGFRPGAYFPNSTIVNKATGGEQAVHAAIPKIKGQLILEGESGLGKTMFLRHIIQNALGRQARQEGRFNKLRHIFRPAPIIVFLPADRCSQGVSEAIQAKLHGMAKDPKFLRNLIYSGAIDICIDGLNEVTADTRAKITEFVESYFKGNIIMTTQPLEWRSPATATTFVLQPLARRQVDDFLVSREPTLPIDAPVRGSEYREACDRYLTAMFHPEQNQEEQRATRIILSNPMDLTLVAQLLSQSETPDLLRLQEQQYTLMAQDYRQKHLQPFPLQPFSECVYNMRLTDQTAIPEAEFYHELQCMERHKMVTRREATDSERKPTKTWHFRHDKIMEYFIVQTFLGEGNDRPNQHFDDPRFRGVYLLLAKLLPLPVAEGLQQQLVYYAADTRDHTVSDDFIQLVRSRSGASAIAPKACNVGIPQR